MFKKRKTFILSTTTAAVLVLIIAFYFFQQIRLGVERDNLSNLSAFGTQLDAHFDQMNSKYFPGGCEPQRICQPGRYS